MQKIIPPAWQAWLRENLANGCSIESLTKIMHDNKFDQAVVVRMIAQIQDQIANESVAAASMQGEQASLKSTSNAFISRWKKKLFSSAKINTQIVKQAKNDQIANQANDEKFVYEQPRIDMTANYIDADNKRVYLSAKVEKPVIVVLDNLLSHAECDELIALSCDRVQRSKVVDNDTGEEVLYDRRTSSGTFFQRGENQLVKTLEKRIAAVSNMPIEHGEGIQILNYQVGGEYIAHYDYFLYEVAGSSRHIKQSGQRVATVIMYLNEVLQGGETEFPNLGLRVVPKKGAAVYFEYCNSKNQVNPLTLHAGLPVIKGEKWIATKWIRQRHHI